MQPISFIIHLDTAFARKENVATIQKTVPGQSEVVQAVPANDPSVASGYVAKSIKPDFYGLLSKGEMACLKSHMKCWQLIVERGFEMALIFEDDAALDAELFREALHLAVENADTHSFIRFPAKPEEKPATVLATAGATSLFRPETVGLKTTAQLVGRSAAERLLAFFQSYDRPVDTALQMTWETGQDIWSLSPSGVKELNSNSSASSITRKKGWRNRLRTEILRPIYRARIAHLSKSNTKDT